MLTATDLASYAEELAAKYDFECEILEKSEMEELGMGGILAVNQGSAEPPKMIVLKYQGKRIGKTSSDLSEKELPLTQAATPLKRNLELSA